MMNMMKLHWNGKSCHEVLGKGRSILWAGQEFVSSLGGGRKEESYVVRAGT